MKFTYIYKRIALTFLSLMVGGMLAGYSQQESQFTQYMFNTQLVNPAYAGNRGMLSLNAMYRAQWIGLEGAPETMGFTMNSPVSERVGLGLSFFNDKIGPVQESNIAADFSYTVPLNDNELLLSLGLKGGVNFLNIDFNKLSVFEHNDPEFLANIEHRISPAVGLGLFLHKGNTWYLGLSSPNFIATKQYGNNVVSNAQEKVSAYFIGGYVIALGSNTQFKPAFLFKGANGAPLAMDISANFLFYKRFMLGAAYRLDVAVSGLLGFQLNGHITLGYGYDYDTTNLSNYNSGSHEIFIRFEIGTKKRKTVNPRFF